MNMRSALGWSSNIYFYTIGGGHGGIAGLGVDRLTGYYRQFGLGELSGIDLPGEAAGRVPDREWKKQTKNEDWYIGDTYNISIGQGDLVVTPMQMTLGDMAVANNGQLLKPWLVKQIGSEAHDGYKLRRQMAVDSRHLQVVREGMRRVLTDGTTGEALFANVPVKVAGKSGTAETGKNVEPHAWFAGFAPYEDPQIMATVIIENGGGGSQRSAPPVATVMQAYFQQ
jgi:penicillin-binding protein 2